MQEQLNLLQVPHVDTSRLSTIGDFYRYVDKVKDAWDINLEFNDNARWRPGSYERLKEQVVNALFYHWSKPKGANTIKKLTAFNQYSCRTLRTDLINIDDRLRVFRKEKQTLDIETAKKEGDTLLKEYTSELFRPVKGVDVSITSIPFFAKERRSTRASHEIFERDWDNPSHPVVDISGKIRTFESYTAANIQKRYKIYNLNTNPKRWFVNVIIPLHDIDIEYYIGRDSEEIVTKNHYGNLVVCFTIPLFDAILNYRLIKVYQDKKYDTSTIERLLNTTYYSNHTFKMPFNRAINHPFIMKDPRKYNYQWGNTCFGDFRPDITFYLSTGMMGELKAVLTKWAKTYYLSGTSPLNQPESHHLGMPLNWSNDISSRMGTDTKLCSKAINEGLEKEDLIDNFCSNCQLKSALIKDGKRLRPQCQVYKKITQVIVPMPSSIAEAIDNEIDNKGLPGLKIGYSLAEAKAIIIDLAENLWHIYAYGEITDTVDATHILFRTDNRGLGNLKHNKLMDYIKFITTEMLAPEEEMDTESIGKNMYNIFRHCERIYWEYSVSYHNETLWDELNRKIFDDIDKAEAELPIADYRMMINTYNIQMNNVAYLEYLDVINNSIQGDANNGQF